MAGNAFVTSAKANRTSEVEAGFEPKYTVDEIDNVEVGRSFVSFCIC